MLHDRSQLQHARTILIKVGTEVVNSPDGLLALGKMGSIVEQIARLHMQGKHIILVSSGAVAIGKMVLKRQHMLSGSMQAHLKGRLGSSGAFNPKACAAAGQSGMQSLYEVLFSQYHLACSQILTSDTDFRVPQIRANVKDTILALLKVGIIPVINENDVVSQRRVPLTDADDRIAWDNDSLASLVAQEVNVDCMIVLTDTVGLYDPTTKALVHEYTSKQPWIFAPSSRVGPLGQQDKVLACVEAVNSGLVQAAIVAPAAPGSIVDIVDGKTIGTLFHATPAAPLELDVPSKL
ncbi:delta-1-pyrroline-5-carboxylate synthetase [Achlya hypogyna]|uniref:Delta-1-pyrroline-5-carboxylate synthetase n=1 Tax=Achlya hypogyna TaxID=1202772 RepID=A0A1V9Z5T3_ACHHY|nr:delta-1-pyrroline-5-carboxylate synthetase [Achlya hypogyna]